MDSEIERAIVIRILLSALLLNIGFMLSGGLNSSIPRTTSVEYLAGVLALETQLRAPVIDFNPEMAEEQEYPNAKKGERVAAVPARERLQNFTVKRGRDYFGRELEDGFITGPKFASVMDCSHDTALRWLQRFEDAEILTLHSTGRMKMYTLEDRFAEIRQREGRRDYKTRDEIVETASELVQLAGTV